MLTVSYGMFIAARAFTGSLQGLFIAIAFVAGISIVSPECMGRAISVIISGVAISAALGVPLGTLVGQRLGWPGSFTAIVVLAVIALIATLVLVLSVPGASGGGGQARYARSPCGCSPS